jgi:hypothetical protein
VVKINLVFCLNWYREFLIRLIRRIEVVVRMLVLHGRGKHLLTIQVILTFFFVCPWQKYLKNIFKSRNISFFFRTLGIRSGYGCCAAICKTNRLGCATDICYCWCV